MGIKHKNIPLSEPKLVAPAMKLRNADQSIITLTKKIRYPSGHVVDPAAARAAHSTGEVANKAETGCGYIQKIGNLVGSIFSMYKDKDEYKDKKIDEIPNVDSMPWLKKIIADEIHGLSAVDPFENQLIFSGFNKEFKLQNGNTFNGMIRYIESINEHIHIPILQYFHDTKYGQIMLPYMRRDYIDILIELTTRPDLVMPFVLTSYPQSSGIMGDRYSNNIIVDHWANIVFKGYKCVGPFLYTNPETREQNHICLKMPIFGIRTAWGQGGCQGFYFLPTSNHFTLFELIEFFCYLCSDSRGRVQPSPRLKELFNAAFFREEAAKPHRGPDDTPENVCGRACRYSDKSMENLNLSFLKVPTRDENSDENGDENVMDLLTNLLKEDFVVKERVDEMDTLGGRARKRRQTKRRRQTNKNQRMKKYDKKRKTNKRRCKKSRRI